MKYIFAGNFLLGVKKVLVLILFSSATVFATAEDNKINMEKRDYLNSVLQIVYDQDEIDKFNNQEEIEKRYFLNCLIY